MKNSPIQIGPITLKNFEVPSSVRFGGQHRLAVHHVADGTRVVERLGPDDSEITFRGTFSGPDSEARVREFDNLRLSGEIVWLTWKSFKRRVLVRSFIAEYRSPWWIPYQVSCTVVHQTGASVSSLSNAAVTILADLGSALSATAASPIQLSALQAVVSQQNALVLGTLDHARATAAVAASLATLETQIAQRSASLLAQPSPTAPSESLGELISTTVNCAGSLAGAANAKAYIGRIGVNINGSLT